MRTAMMPRKLSIVDITAGYDRADVLKSVAVDVQPGAVTCILGANGAGKSTLIRTILGLNRARSGAVYFGGDDITNLPTHKIAALGISTVPEGNRVLPRMTVLENLLVGGVNRLTNLTPYRRPILTPSRGVI